VLVAVQELTQTETAAVVALAVCVAQFKQLVAVALYHQPLAHLLELLTL
jgi:hypothetical protein